MRTRRPVAALLGLAVLVPLLAGCGNSGVTAGKLEGSIAPTFGRLYVRQQVEQGNPRPVLSRIRVRARCVKGGPDESQHGAGSDWVCYVTYLADGPGTLVRAIYNANVQTNGCYAADGDGPASLNGGQTITGPGYRQVPNPLYLINGCFDVG